MRGLIQQFLCSSSLLLDAEPCYLTQHAHLGSLSPLICWLSVLCQAGVGFAAPLESTLRPGAPGTKGAVASESTRCSKIGIDMIELGVGPYFCIYRSSTEMI